MRCAETIIARSERLEYANGIRGLFIAGNLPISLHITIDSRDDAVAQVLAVIELTRC